VGFCGEGLSNQGAVWLAMSSSSLITCRWKMRWSSDFFIQSNILKSISFTLYYSSCNDMIKENQNHEKNNNERRGGDMNHFKKPKKKKIIKKKMVVHG
jgi:hypothetical protein